MTTEQDQWVRPSSKIVKFWPGTTIPADQPRAWANALTEPAALPTSPVLVYTYADVAEFNAGAAHMAQGNYYPISQSQFGPVSHGHGLSITILALLLSPFTLFLSILVGLILYLVTKSTTPGGITVTYQLRAS